MKLRSKHIIFLFIICILFSITAVSASDNQAVDADYGFSQSIDDVSIDENLNQGSQLRNDVSIDDDSGLGSQSDEQSIDDDLSQGFDSDGNLGEIESNEENSNADESVSYGDNIDSNDLLSEEGDYRPLSELSQLISISENELNLSYDYRYDNTSFEIEKDSDFTINGNNHVIEGLFDLPEAILVNSPKNIVFNNLTFLNCKGCTFAINANATFNNVRFINCLAAEGNLFMGISESATFENCSFQNMGTSTYFLKCDAGNYTFKNSVFNGGCFDKGLINADRNNLFIENCTFENISSRLATVLNYKGWNLTIKNSRFIDLHANASAGAILAKYFPNEIYIEGKKEILPNDPYLIEDCEFIDLTSANDGGAIHFDMDSGKGNSTQTFNISNCNFTNCKAKYGGAISGIGGILNISDTRLESNCASFEGGAIYTSWTNVSLSRTVLSNGSAKRNGGAIYFDKGKLTINDSSLLYNKVEEESDNKAGAIYAHDAVLDFNNTIFDNGGVSVYADFAPSPTLENIERKNDIFSLDNMNYIVSVESNGIKINIINKSTDIDTVPGDYDSREYGWVTPVRIQGDNDDCWAFATVASLESALLKATGVEYTLSPNYLQSLQLKYAINGDLRNSLTGFAYSGLGYALSWYGVLPVDGVYDDRGVIADTDFADERIHLQDALFIFGSGEETINQIKEAIMKYGAVTVQLFSDNPPEVATEGDDIAVMVHDTHFLSLIGWDNFPEDQDVEPYFITKDSLGSFGSLAFNSEQLIEMDNYAIVPQRVAIAYIFENDIDYHVNYQTDLTGLVGFDANYTYYSNKFISKYDEWIGAVGTYFNESGINYSFDIFVNGEKVHTQTGVSEFAGFRTIVLNKHIPINTGDEFKVVFKSNALPYQAYSRQHYVPGMSLVSNDGSSWTDLSTVNKTVCLKVYTETNPIFSFSELKELISQSENELNLSYDYKYDNTSIEINKTGKFVINGNNHIFYGLNTNNAFNFSSDDLIVINNLTFQDCSDGVLTVNSPVTFNNVRFINCSVPNNPSFLDICALTTFENCTFQDMGSGISYISCADGDSPYILTLKNSVFNGGSFDKGLINVNRVPLYVENCTFENMSSRLATVINYKGWNITVKNSRFTDLHANASAGAIMIKYFPNEVIGEFGVEPTILPNDPFVIEGCEFINVTSANDGGAIHFDMDSGAHHLIQIFNISNCNFTNCEARYGGAISGIGGFLNISDSKFDNCHASFEGGAIYTSWTNVSLSRTVLSNGSAMRNGGAIYFDKGKLTINDSALLNNKVEKESDNRAGAIYAHDAVLDFSDSTFDNGGVSVYADFAGDSKIENIERNNDLFSLDNKDYIVSVESNGIKIKLVNNSIILDKLPSKFNLDDYGWVTPCKIQGDNYDCWAFATVASLETAILKATGVEYNLSQNYVQKLQLKYAINGDLRSSLTGFAYSGVGYALSWYGALPLDGAYDDRGMIADTDFADERIHVQDVLFIFGPITQNVDLIKRAIMQYGGVTVQLVLENPIEPASEGEDIAEPNHSIHFISLIGWDDDLNDPNSDGHWITKDSQESSFGTKPFDSEDLDGMDYYAIIPQRLAIAYIFENDIDYHVNYQTDLTGLTGFDGNYTYYSNEFISKYDELIGAVGTYFNESGINYSFDVFVNGKKVHTQTGVSEFSGFRTIVLNKYIPIKTGDVFKVVFKNNAVPYQAYSRQHYISGMSLVSNDGSSWIDLSKVNKTVCLKVYTVADDTKVTGNKDLSVNYGAGSYFSVKVVTADGRPVGAGEKVTFTIKGRTVTATTDNNGIAKIKITEVPGKYLIKTNYKGISYQNNVAVKLDPKTCKVVNNKNIKVDYAGGKYFSVKVVSKDGKVPASGVKVKFKINGKTYTRTTNKKGIAKLKITFVPKKYTIKTIFNGKTYKNTVKVKQVLKTSKVTVKKTAKKFTLKAKLKINEKLKKGKTIKFKFNGKTYKAKTNKKGIAKVSIKKKVIKKLKKGKKYTFKVTYLKDTIKSTVKVKK